MFTWKWKLTDIKQDKPVTVFSCFSCGGGSSMGYKRAGFKVLGNVELDPRVNALYVKNLSPRFNFNMDLRAFNAIPDADLPPELFALDILDGSPPCSSFSMSGARERLWGVEKKFREGQKDQTLDDLFFVFLETVEKLRPRIFVAENVAGIIAGVARGYVNEILKRSAALGYRVQLFKLNSARMNVPQARERIFFVGTREAFPPLRLNFSEPLINFGDVRGRTGKFTADGVLADLVRRRLPSDKNLSDVAKRVNGKAYAFNFALLSDDSPAHTLTSGNNMYRHCDGLACTTEDYRNISTFPQDYDFMDQVARYVCGMSVPPNMMANLAEQIYGQWLKK